MKEWKEFMIAQVEYVLVFKEKRVRLRYNRKENLIAYLEKVEKWEEKDTIDSVEKEDEMKCDKAKKKIQSKKW